MEIKDQKSIIHDLKSQIKALLLKKDEMNSTALFELPSYTHMKTSSEKLEIFELSQFNFTGESLTALSLFEVDHYHFEKESTIDLKEDLKIGLNQKKENESETNEPPVIVSKEISKQIVDMLKSELTAFFQKPSRATFYNQKMLLGINNLPTEDNKPETVYKIYSDMNTEQNSDQTSQKVIDIKEESPSCKNKRRQSEFYSDAKNNKVNEKRRQSVVDSSGSQLLNVPLSNTQNRAATQYFQRNQIENVAEEPEDINMSQIMLNKNKVDFDLSSESKKEKEKLTGFSEIINSFLNEVVESSLDELKLKMRNELKNCKQDIGQRKMIFSDKVDEIKQISFKSKFKKKFVNQIWNFRKWKWSWTSTNRE